MATKDKSKTLTPRLRFPEFKDAPRWEETPFADLYKFKPTNTLSRDKLNYDTGTIRNIHYGDIHTRFQTHFDLKREHVPFVTNGRPDDFDDSAFCTEGDLVFADASEDLNDVGKSIEVVALHGELVLSGTHTILATRRDSQLIVGFGGYLFRSEKIRCQIRRESQGSKVYGISPRRLADINVCFPASEAEQRKIAACLASLDELLVAEGRKLEALRAHKKGLMQQLFPRHGESRPRLRFPEFRDAGEWKTRKIGGILSRKAEAAALKDDEMYREIGIRSHGKGLFHKEPTMGRTIGEKRVFHVVPGALAINIVFAWEQAIAVTTIDEVGLIASHRFPMFVPRENRCDVSFIQRLFLMPPGKELLKVASPGGAGRNRTLNQKEFENLDVLIPETAEQQRIAACLASLDALIAGASRKLDILRAHRKGLMQQLFPSPEGD